MPFSLQTKVALATGLASQSAASEIEHEIYTLAATLPQPLDITDSPTFQNVNLTGYLTVDGIKVVGNQGALITPLIVTASVGALPTPNGDITIGNATTGLTQVEALDFCMELKASIDLVINTLKTHGLISSV